MKHCPKCKRNWSHGAICPYCDVNLAEGAATSDISALMKSVREIFDDIERRAENAMLKTGKLEGAHYVAPKEARKELGAQR